MDQSFMPPVDLLSHRFEDFRSVPPRPLPSFPQSSYYSVILYESALYLTKFPPPLLDRREDVMLGTLFLFVRYGLSLDQRANDLLAADVVGWMMPQLFKTPS